MKEKNEKWRRPEFEYQSFEELPLFLVIDEVCWLLRVNRKTIYDAIARDEFPCVRVGRSLRFGKEDVLKFLKTESKAGRLGRQK